MAIRPSVPEIITVNSEDLQQQIRDLLPSQNGFGSELQASNVITPIIDLTAAAEGSSLPVSLQQSLAFGSVTAFQAQGSTDVIENSPGFYRIFGTAVLSDSAVAESCEIQMSDGLSTKNLIRFRKDGTGMNGVVNYDFLVFLRPGDSVSAISASADAFLSGCSRQVATGDGTLVQPNGFPL